MTKSEEKKKSAQKTNEQQPSDVSSRSERNSPKKSIPWGPIFNFGINPTIAVLAFLLPGYFFYWQNLRVEDSVSLSIIKFDAIERSDDEISLVLNFSVVNTGTRSAIITTMQMHGPRVGYPRGHQITHWRELPDASLQHEPLLVLRHELITRQVFFDFDLTDLEIADDGYTLMTLHIEVIDGKGDLHSREIAPFGLAVKQGRVTGQKIPAAGSISILPKPASDTSKPDSFGMTYLQFNPPN